MDTNGAGYYNWTPIADSDAVKALQAAAQAQDTADQKRRIFVVRPTTPLRRRRHVDAGRGGSDHALRQGPRRGAFAAADWAPAGDYYKYTDTKVEGVRTTIDASALDQNTYYPVTMRISGTARGRFVVRVQLSEPQPGYPAWSNYEGRKILVPGHMDWLPAAGAQHR